MLSSLLQRKLFFIICSYTTKIGVPSFRSYMFQELLTFGHFLLNNEPGESKSINLMKTHFVSKKFFKV